MYSVLDRPADSPHPPATPETSPARPQPLRREDSPSRIAAAGLDLSPELVAMTYCSGDCIKLLEPDGRLAYMSANAARAMKDDTSGALYGTFWWDLWPDQLRETVKRAVGIARMGRLANFIAPCPTARGIPAFWDVTVTGITNEHGEVCEILAVTRRTLDRPRPL